MDSQIHGYQDISIARYMDSQIHGQLDIWIARYMDSQLYGKLDIWIARYMDSQIYGQLDIWIARYMDSQIYGQLDTQNRYMDSQIYGQLDIQIARYMDSQTYRQLDIWIARDSWIARYMDISIYVEYGYGWLVRKIEKSIYEILCLNCHKTSISCIFLKWIFKKNLLGELFTELTLFQLIIQIKLITWRYPLFKLYFFSFNCLKVQDIYNFIKSE